jgi:hypothetical protein
MNVKMRLTDQRNRAVNTAGEFWSARLLVTYQIPHVSSLDH